MVPRENGLDYDGIVSGPTIYAYVGGNPVSYSDPLGLYPAVVVTLPNGTQYAPTTTVKNDAQAQSFGVPVGTTVAIPIPPGADPAGMVNQWFQTPAGSYLSFGLFWHDPAHDYKLIDARYDAFGNFMYGATGAANGISCDRLQNIADKLHHGKNNPINRIDIQSGYDAVWNGGTIGSFDYEPYGP